MAKAEDKQRHSKIEIIGFRAKKDFLRTLVIVLCGTKLWNKIVKIISTRSTMPTSSKMNKEINWPIK